MMRTFLYYATCFGQLGSRKHFGKIAFSFQKCPFNGTIIYNGRWGWWWGGGEGGVIPFRTGGFKNFGLIISLGHVTKKINSKLRRVLQINEQIANH